MNDCLSHRISSYILNDDDDDDDDDDDNDNDDDNNDDNDDDNDDINDNALSVVDKDDKNEEPSVKYIVESKIF